jgi:hypothetical protein
MKYWSPTRVILATVCGLLHVAILFNIWVVMKQTPRNITIAYCDTGVRV